MKTSGLIASSPCPRPSNVDRQQMADVPAIRAIQVVRTSAVGIAFTVAGVVAHVVLELTYARKGW